MADLRSTTYGDTTFTIPQGGSDNTFVFDVDSDQFTEDPDNPDGKHYGMTITSPTYDELLAMLRTDTFVYARLLYNSGNAYETMQLFHNGNSIYGRYFDVEFPQKRLQFASAYVNKRNNDTYFGTYQDYIGGSIDAYTKAETDDLLDAKQDTLVSGTNIKIVNGESLLGSGDLDLDEIFYIPVDEDNLTPSTVQPQGVKEGILTTPYTIEEIWAQHTAGKLCAVLLSNTTDGNEDRFLPLEFNGDPQVVGAQAWNESLNYDYESGQVTEPTAKALVVSIVKQTSATKVYVTRTDMRGTVDQSYDPTSTNAQSGTAVAEAVGDLSSLTTTAQDNLVNAVNELKSDVSALGEPFRVKEWDRTGLSTVVPMVTEEIANTSIDTFLYQITGQEATDYQIVGMIAYQLLDANNTRINAFPVCQFTGGGQTELRVRFMCGGTSRKTAASIKAWVLLKHR